MEWAPENLPRIAEALGEHLMLVLLSVGCAFVISLVIGVWSARRPRAFAAVIAITGVLFAVPSLALFALLIPWFGIGAIPAIIGLTAYSLMILVRNIAAGFHAVPPEVLDAANGMGYGRWRRLSEIELPIAMPFIVAGVRIATVTIIGIATVAAYINAGGLGAIIFEGIDQRFPEKILVGGLLTSALAIGVDYALTRVERSLRVGAA